MLRKELLLFLFSLNPSSYSFPTCTTSTIPRTSQDNDQRFHLASIFPSFSQKHITTRGGRKIITSSSSLSFSSSSSSSYDASSLLYEEQEKMLVDRGAYEETIMQEHISPLQAHKPKGVGTAGGFGGGSGSGSKANKKSSKKSSAASAATLQQQGEYHAQVLQKEGIIRIDNVLSKATASKLREWVMQHRQESTQLVQEGKIQPLDRFAQVLLQKNRCDLTLPLGPDEEQEEPIIMDALYQVLCMSAVPDTLAGVFRNMKGDHDSSSSTTTTSSSSSPILYEFSTLISDPGSQRQVVHPDNPMIRTSTTSSSIDNQQQKEQEGELQTTPPPVLLTCFVALQDIQPDMGPTVWLPGTHTQDAHDQFFHSDESIKDRLLQTSNKVLGVLPQGCCAIYDSRVLHCGTANRAFSSSLTSSRALFYFSFKNPQIAYPGNPASIRKSVGDAKYSLDQLQTLLRDYHNNRSHNKK